MEAKLRGEAELTSAEADRFRGDSEVSILEQLKRQLDGITSYTDLGTWYKNTATLRQKLVSAKYRDGFVSAVCKKRSELQTS